MEPGKKGSKRRRTLLLRWQVKDALVTQVPQGGLLDASAFSLGRVRSLGREMKRVPRPAAAGLAGASAVALAAARDNGQEVALAKEARTRRLGRRGRRGRRGRAGFARGRLLPRAVAVARAYTAKRRGGGWSSSSSSSSPRRRLGGGGGGCVGLSVNLVLWIRALRGGGRRCSIPGMPCSGSFMSWLARISNSKKPRSSLCISRLPSYILQSFFFTFTADDLPGTKLWLGQLCLPSSS